MKPGVRASFTPDFLVRVSWACCFSDTVRQWETQHGVSFRVGHLGMCRYDKIERSMTPVFLARDGNSGGIDGKVMSDQVAQEGTMFFHVLEELLFLLWVFMAMKKVSALICSSREGDVLGDHTVAIITEIGRAHV